MSEDNITFCELNLYESDNAGMFWYYILLNICFTKSKSCSSSNNDNNNNLQQYVYRSIPSCYDVMLWTECVEGIRSNEGN